MQKFSNGYHIEHNFGHSIQYLDAMLLSLNLLTFLLHTNLDMVGERYQTKRQTLGSPVPFFKT